MLKILFVDMTPIGSLQVYAVMTEEAYNRSLVDGNAEPKEIYWCDSGAVKPQGPFALVTDAMDNWKSVVLARRGIEEKDALERYSKSLQTEMGLNPAAVAVSNVAPKDNVINIAEWKASKAKYKQFKR